MFLNIITKAFPLIKVSTAVLILIASSANQSFGQKNTVNSIPGQFASYQEKNLQEKLFVHTDKSFYLAGEILWFKIYSVEGSLNKPLDLSKVAYLEVLDKDQNPLIQTKVSMKQGSGKGSVYLPVSINPGNYKLRAYTNWMKNFSPDFYFEKNITIINSLKDAEAITQEKPLSVGYDIQFFLEGGNLVSGIKSKIAFKGIDLHGKGIELEGTLINQNNETVANFQSLKFGIGSFYFTPESDMKYTALVKLPNGQVLRKELPVIFETGYVMHVNAVSSGQIAITVQSNDPLNSQVYLFVHTRHVKKITETVEIINGKAEFLIDKDKLGDGISSFTIFNQNKQPVCERLYFKYPKQNLIIETSTDKAQYASRKKVNVNISLHDIKNQSLVADLSVSIFRLDSLHSVDQNDISNYLWLTSDLKGNIESPDYYLKNNGKETDEAVDNLMLTHGWRRFKWENVLQNKTSSLEFLPEYTGHIVTGKVVNTQTGTPVGNTIIYLSVPGRRVQFYTSKSNNEGQINFYTKDFYGSNEILTHINRIDSICRVTISSPFSSKFSPNILSAFNPYKNLLYKQLLSNSVNVQVQNIYWGDMMKQFHSPVTDSSAFYGPPSKSYLLDNYTRFTTMEEVLREYILESALSVSKKQYALKLMKPDQEGFIDHLLILLDGIPVFNTNQVVSYDPIKVKAIDIINKEYFWGATSFNGIISFRTYNGGSPGFTMEPGSTSIDYEGLQLQREFYLPVYETDKQLSSRIPDFRDLLYWSPDAGTDSQGKKQFSFYTSDQTGKYALVLQGITANGNTISRVLTFEVKNTL